MSSISARSLIGWGVRRRAMVAVSMEKVDGGIGFASADHTTSGSLHVFQ